MNRLITAGIVVVAVAVAGCGKSSTSEKISNPQVQQEVKKDEAKAEAIVKHCLSTTHGKTALVHCLAPPGHEKAMEECAVKAVSTDLFHRSKLPAALAVCVEKNR